MEATLDPKQLQRFRDPIWRISNLYAIRTRDGKVVPFRPRPQQLQVLQMIYRQGFKRIVIRWFESDIRWLREGVEIHRE